VCKGVCLPGQHSSWLPCSSNVSFTLCLSADYEREAKLHFQLPHSSSAHTNRLLFAHPTGSFHPTGRWMVPQQRVPHLCATVSKRASCPCRVSDNMYNNRSRAGLGWAPTKTAQEGPRQQQMTPAIWDPCTWELTAAHCGITWCAMMKSLLAGFQRVFAAANRGPAGAGLQDGCSKEGARSAADDASSGATWRALHPAHQRMRVHYQRCAG